MFEGDVKKISESLQQEGSFLLGDSTSLSGEERAHTSVSVLLYDFLLAGEGKDFLDRLPCL